MSLRTNIWPFDSLSNTYHVCVCAFVCVCVCVCLCVLCACVCVFMYVVCVCVGVLCVCCVCSRISGRCTLSPMTIMHVCVRECVCA